MSKWWQIRWGETIQAADLETCYEIGGDRIIPNRDAAIFGTRPIEIINQQATDDALLEVIPPGLLASSDLDACSQ